MQKKIIVFILTLLLTFVSAYPQISVVVKCDKQLLERSRELLLSQVGVREKTGHNDGKEVEKYFLSVGLNPKGKYPYCAAGQVWCFYQGCIDLNLPFSEIPIARTGSANGIMNAALKTGERLRYYINAIDALIVWKARDGTGHIERTVELRNVGWVVTVGFNTTSGAGNQREGGGVYKRLRSTKDVLGRMLYRGNVILKGI